MKNKRIDLEKYGSIGALRPGYKRSSKKWVHDGDFSGSFQTDHWDGRRDATVRAPSVNAKTGVNNDKGDE